MQQSSIYQKIKEAVDAIQIRVQGHSHQSYELGIILGSGLGSIADQVEDAVVIPYSEIPHFHGTSVEGHAGQMILGKFKGVSTVFLKGRFHLYEGYAMEEVVFPTRTICGLGIHTLLLTNAAGGINTRYRPGELMVIQDHLNLMGDNPLKGPNLSQLGPRFPDLSEAYSGICIEILKTAAHELEIPMQTGVYAGLLGPTYETPAEVRMLRTLGADAVGMSTVPESIAANHLGVRVAGVSCISNLAAGMTSHKLTHKEVIDNSKEATASLARLLEKAVPRLVHRPNSGGTD
ncbi:purine-nucleoside phosphorylase [bacterium]|jgi:purine-nucleoside phosphorylase|nr:purine-nucleoside phosphorylase [bacterium]